jgi:hypothetical protein
LIDWLGRTGYRRRKCKGEDEALGEKLKKKAKRRLFLSSDREQKTEQGHKQHQRRARRGEEENHLYESA